MCLGVPGKVIEWVQRDGVMAKAIIEFAGIRQLIQMACVPDCEVGDYVVVHAGIAISKLNEVEALKTLSDLQAIGELDEQFGRQLENQLGNHDESQLGEQVAKQVANQAANQVAREIARESEARDDEIR